MSSPSPMPTMRLARHGEAGLVREISAAAYVPAYEEQFGWIPKPATEDYTLRIDAGLVWILETDRLGACGVLVIEQEPDALMVYSVAVRPDAQGHGLAGFLLAKAEEIAVVDGFRVVRLYTNSQMTSNIRLYESHGFRKTRRRPHPSRKGLELQDMEKPL